MTVSGGGLTLVLGVVGVVGELEVAGVDVAGRADVGPLEQLGAVLDRDLGASMGCGRLEVFEDHGEAGGGDVELVTRGNRGAIDLHDEFLGIAQLGLVVRIVEGEVVGCGIVRVV